MKTASAGIINNVQQAAAVYSAVQVIAEWNQNRYATITSITNNGVQDYNGDIFPLSSIALPNRPKRGVLKARVSASARSAGIGADGFVSGGYKDTALTDRYVVSSSESKYKYWTSPAESAGTLYTVGNQAISNVQPTILYTNAVSTNKIVVGLENSYASPSAWTVAITTDGTNWTTVSTNPTPDSNGRVTLYRQANGTWSSTVYRDNPTAIKGIRLTVTQMNKARVFFNLIELSPRLEADLSTYVEKWSVNNSMSDFSFVTPLGTTSSNEASLTLSNTGGNFTNDNPSSPYFGILDKGVEFRIDVGISTDTYATTNKTYEWVRMATMVSDKWEGQHRESTTVSLVDDSAYLQTVKPLPVYYQSMTAAEIIWRLLDSIGFSDYNYEKIDTDTAVRIPHFWTDGEKTIWDIMNDFAQPLQMAFYFDEYGILQIKTNTTAYNLTKSTSWQLDAVTNGAKMADIIKLDKTYDYEANTVNIGYKKTNTSEFNKGDPAMEIVWEPEGTTVLRASPLVKPMTAGSASFMIDPKVAATWPYNGVVQIEGEFIRFNGKWYNYYAAGNVLLGKYIYNEDQRKELDKLNQALSFKNFFSGYFACVSNGRGIWNTVAKAHVVDASGYNKSYRHGSGTSGTWNGGWAQIKNKSQVRMMTNSSFKWNSWYVGWRGNLGDQRPNFIGTSLKFNKSTTPGAAGLAMCLGSNESGYYLEVMKTSTLTNNPTWLKNTYELCFYVRHTDGTIKRYGPNGGKGVRMNVAMEVWYDLDVAITTQGSSRTFWVSVNGIPYMILNVPSSGYPAGGDTGRFGIFVRNWGTANFEYLYNTTAAEAGLPDDASFFDRINGGFQSNQAIDEWGYRVRDFNKLTSSTPNAAVIDRYNRFAMDEFGPIVHEVREFNVKFSKTPVLHSRIYFSNETQILCPEYNSDPFGAKFVLANRYRTNAVVSGDDNLTLGPNATLNQRALIYGRPVNQEEEQTVTITDSNGVRRRGEVTVDITSDWIQSEAAAKSIGEWIKLHWAGGADEAQVESFGNPFLQLGDVVSINDPLKSMAPATHKYFVVNIDHTYDKGLTTNLTLRRAKI
jgi:hypothetical protein